MHVFLIDIDECLSNPCEGMFEECVNTSPGYNCICSEGYTRNSNEMCIGEFGDM